jgi:hypothetical protein
MPSLRVRRGLLALGLLILLVPGCGGGANGGKDDFTPSPTEHAAQGGEIVVSSSGVLYGGGEGAQPVVVPNLPGISVVGQGEAKGAPDSVLLRLTVGTGNEFSGPEGVSADPVEESELEPIVQALEEAGAPVSSISVNTYAATPYSGFGSAGQISLTWTRPREVDRAVEVAQDVVRAKTRFSLQSVETLFPNEHLRAPRAGCVEGGPCRCATAGGAACRS